MRKGSYRDDVARITVHGREEATCAENAQDEFVLRVLRGEVQMIGRTFIDLVWFPSANTPRVDRPVYLAPPKTEAFSSLNASQRQVSAAMISPTEPIVIAHGAAILPLSIRRLTEHLLGPPGTGKTTTIAAAVDYWNSTGDAAWIIAQSNVGVKNIARSLLGKGIKDFKLVVSKDFYVEW